MTSWGRFQKIISLLLITLCCLISLAACQREIDIPVLFSPLGEVYDYTTDYQWAKERGISLYQLQIDKGKETIYDELFWARDICSRDGCSVHPDLALVLADYRWRVRGNNGEEWGPFSDYKEFSFVGSRQDLDVNEHDLDDCIATWWINPIAKRFIGERDQTYLGYTDNQGYSGVASIDNLTGEILKTRLRRRWKADDHNAAAVDILPDGRVIAVYSGGHNTASQLLIRLSDKPESVAHFSDLIVVETEKPTTYAQIFQKNDRIWVFFRTGAGDGSSWSYISSEDGLEWDEPVELIYAGQQYYLKIVDVPGTDLLRIVMYSHPNQPPYEIRMGFFDTLTREAKLADGSVLGEEFVSKNDFPVIIEPEGDKRIRMLDVAVTTAGEAAVAYAEFTDHADAEYKIGYIRNDLTVISVVDCGAPFYTGEGCGRDGIWLFCKYGLCPAWA